MESVQIYLLWLACVLLRLQYEVFCFALVISIFYKCSLYPRFAEHLIRRSCPWSRFGVKEELGCRVSTFLCDMCDLKSIVNIGVYV